MAKLGNKCCKIWEILFYEIEKQIMKHLGKISRPLLLRFNQCHLLLASDYLTFTTIHHRHFQPPPDREHIFNLNFHDNLQLKKNRLCIYKKQQQLSKTTVSSEKYRKLGWLFKLSEQLAPTLKCYLDTSWSTSASETRRLIFAASVGNAHINLPVCFSWLK